MTAHSIAHGVLRLEELTLDYGADRRRMRVVKYRGQAYRGGYHDFIIETGGVRIFPRLVSAEHHIGFTPTTVSSGNARLDQLLGGGLEGGSSTLLLGPAGSGKSLLILQFAVTAMRRGENVAMFIFDEELGLLFRRAKQIGFDLESFQRSGNLFVQQIDAAELAPGQFAHRVRELVAEHSVSMIIIDSLNGYQAAMPEERSLILHMHELLQYLNRRGATTFLTIAQHGMVGTMQTPVDVTYLADTVLLLRYFEAEGRIRRALSVIKKRTGAHEYAIREFQVGASGVELGEPLTQFRGVLTGVPTYTGEANPLLQS
jgi:circadian clock protein KaiC